MTETATDATDPVLPKGWTMVACAQVGDEWHCTLEHAECGQISGTGATREAAIHAAITEVGTGDENFSER